MSNKIRIIKSFIQFRNSNRFKSRDKLKRYQAKKLKRHIKFLIKKSEYFKKLVDVVGTDLKNFPLMNKKIMMDNFDSMLTINVNKETALKNAIDSEKSREFDNTLNSYTVGLSSGTSDHRGLFITSEKEMDVWTGAILSRVLPSIKQNYKIAFFLRANSNLYENVSSKKIQFKYFDIYKSFKDNIVELDNFKPDILVAPPSVLILIAKNIQNRSININPQRIISVAEVLEKSDEEYLKDVFKKDIIHQVYQSTEGFLGYTCDYGTIHLNEDMVFIEKEYIDEDRFIPIITDFTRKSQPIVRYRLNDILVVENKPCPCGCQFQGIKKIEGREDDVFIFDGFESEDIHIFPDIIRRSVLYVDNIRNYQVVQESRDTITIYLDTDSSEVKENISLEFNRISKIFNFIMPTINFKKYKHQTDIKLKRIKRN